MMRKNTNSAASNVEEQWPKNRRETQPIRSIFDRDNYLSKSDQSKRPSNYENTNGAELTTTPSDLSTPSNSSAHLDWHTEILCGLFLHSDEQELEWLEREVGLLASSTGCDSSSSQPPSSQSLQQKSDYSSGGKGEPYVEGGHEETRIIQVKTVNEEKSQQQTNEMEDMQNNQTGDFLMEMLHLGQTMDSTVLSLIPEALRGITSEVQQNMTSIDNYCGNQNEQSKQVQQSEIPNARLETSNATDSATNIAFDLGCTSHDRKEPPRGNSDGVPMIARITAAAARLNNNGKIAANSPACILRMNSPTNDNEIGKNERKGHENIENEDNEPNNVKEVKNQHFDESDVDKPLLIPSSWRRSDYARRTLSELEQHVIDTGIGRGDRGSTRGNHTGKNGKNGSNGSKRTPPPRGPKTYDIFTFLYNECSFSAMANWAMLDYSTSGSNNDNNTERWEKCKKEQEKRRFADKERYEVIVAPPTYHLCGVCGRFGHYEVECGLLFEDGGEKRGRDTSAGDEERKRPESKKKMRVYDDSAKEIVLDAHFKNGVISSLSKEIHIQSRQQKLFVDYCMQKKKENVKEGYVQVVATATSATSASESLNRRHGQKKEEGGDEIKYAGKSTCCKICHSGIDDGEMLLCDGCDELFHCRCLDPPLDGIPEGDWFCSECISHDSDASSIVEIEGCGDFVIEQRKQSVAEEERLYSGVSLGHPKSAWTAALSLLPEQDPIVEDELYLQKHLGREYGHMTKDFFHGELCWAKRFDDQLGRLEWWPGMVSDSETRALKSSNKTTYKVKFFALNDGAEVHETEILPFMPYYEGIGHKRLMRCDNSGHGTFRNALILCVSTLGLKSLGQALKLARNGIQMAAVRNNGNRRLLPPGWKIPVGWESSEIDRIDGVVILAKEGGSEHMSPIIFSHDLDVLNDIDEVGGMTSKYSDGIKDSNHDQDSLAIHKKMVAWFCVDEIIGSIISWQSDFGVSSSNESSYARYGVVVSINTATEMALVRAMPMLSEVSLGKLDDLFDNDSNELLIHASNVGSTTWIPLRHVRFVSGKPSTRKLAKFRRKLESNMRHEMELNSTRSKREAKYREEYTMELKDSPDPDPLPNNVDRRGSQERKDTNKPLVSCPFCGFQTHHLGGLTMHVRACERVRARR